MIRRPPRSTLFPYTNALPIWHYTFPSPGHAPQGWPRNRRELPISSHTRRTASGNGSGGTRNQGSTGGSMDGSGAVLQPYSTDEGGEPQGSRKGAATASTGGKGEADVRIC